MSLWVLLAAPLLAGNDLGKMSAEDKGLLMNKEALAIDQDPLGKQGDRVWQRRDFSVWSKLLSGGRTAVGFVNSAGDQRDFAVDLGEIGFPNGASLHDVWRGMDLGHRGEVQPDNSQTWRDAVHLQQ